jgi:hypothetical protein
VIGWHIRGQDRDVATVQWNRDRGPIGFKYSSAVCGLKQTRHSLGRAALLISNLMLEPERLAIQHFLHGVINRAFE